MARIQQFGFPSPTQIINPATPSILSTLNSYFSTCAEATSYELDLRADNLSNFIANSEKDESATHADTSALHHAKENNTNVLQAKCTKE